MPFLPPNQQRQSTEGNKRNKEINKDKDKEINTSLILMLINNN